MSQPNTRIAVAVSGEGTLLQAIHTHPLPLSLVVADRECLAYDYACRSGIPTALLRRPGSGERLEQKALTALLTEILDEHRIDLLAMAGFRRVLSPSIFERYARRILNSHPSLLPKYPGLHAVREALAAGDTETGATIHLALPEVDKIEEDTLLGRVVVEILPGDTETTLRSRIKEAERGLYPPVIGGYRYRLLRS